MLHASYAKLDNYCLGEGLCEFLNIYISIQFFHDLSLCICLW